jgi:hypothetical protein
MEKSIPLSQKLYLLGIHPQKGGTISASYGSMDYILIGSLLMELYQNKNIRFEKKRVLVAQKRSENELHQFLLDKITKTPKTLKISRWINKLYFSRKYIRKEVQKNLYRNRYISMKDKKFLFFSWEVPVLLNKQAVYGLLSEIETAIFKGTESEDELILLSFLIPAGLLKRIFPDKEKRKQAKIRIKKIATENQVSDAVAHAIAASQAVAASVAATAAATTAATSS